jgi:hypothetical protein
MNLRNLCTRDSPSRRVNPCATCVQNNEVCDSRVNKLPCVTFTLTGVYRLQGDTMVTFTLAQRSLPQHSVVTVYNITLAHRSSGQSGIAPVL